MKIFKIAFVSMVSAAALVACGGGGGSGGESHGPYSITLSADKTLLPLNTRGIGPGIGAYSPFTTTIYVRATELGRPIPGGEKIFGCNMEGGLESGALYYLDGDDEHEDDDGNPLAYRSITLDSNSGGNSFHFHAGDRTGTSRIVCTVTDPRDKKSYATSIDITVGSPTGHAATLRAITQAPYYLGTQENLNKIPTSVVVQAFVTDDANQPVANPAKRNVQVSIRPGTPAAQGARLLASDGRSGSVLQVSTIAGVGQFSLASGPVGGPIVLEMVTDRADNDVTNGIQDPVSSLTQVYAVSQVATAPLAISANDLGVLTNGVEFAYALEATGGVPPYKWTVTGLPDGLSVDESGVISGTPKAPAGIYRVKIAVVDANGDRQEANLTLELVGDHREINPEDFTVNGCTGDVNVICRIPGATVGGQYTYAFSASVPGVTWEFSGLPGWLEGGTAGSNGFISGSPKAPADCGTHQFLVTAKRGVTSVTRRIAIAVAGAGC